MKPHMKSFKRSILVIFLLFKKGIKRSEAHANLRVATSDESNPDSVLPINPNEKAHNTETSARYSIILIQ